MICELCGEDAPFLKPILIEGSILRVCQRCMKFGKDMSIGSRPATGPEKKPADSNWGMGGRVDDTYIYGRVGDTSEGIIKKRLEQRERKQQTKDIFEQTGDKVLVDDYHKLIQQSRMNFGWSQEELGKKINERKSIISKLENKTIKPDDRLVRKLERALGIKLMETIQK